MRSLLLSIGAVAAMWLASAQAQDLPPKIWDIKLGIPISALPLKDFVDPASDAYGSVDRVMTALTQNYGLISRP